MKKAYIQPMTSISYGAYKYEILSASRLVSGGPTDPEDGGISIPGTVGETDGELDPYDGHGQGSGGSGNRAPERWGSLW